MTQLPCCFHAFNILENRKQISYFEKKEMNFMPSNAKTFPSDLNYLNGQAANHQGNNGPVHTCTLTYKCFACGLASQNYKFEMCQDHALTHNLEPNQKTGINELINKLNAIFASFPANNSHHFAGIMTLVNMTQCNIEKRPVEKFIFFQFGCLTF